MIRKETSCVEKRLNILLVIKFAIIEFYNLWGIQINMVGPIREYGVKFQTELSS